MTVEEAQNRREQENERAAARIQRIEVVQQERLAKMERDKKNQENAIDRLQEAARAINVGTHVWTLLMGTMTTQNILAMTTRTIMWMTKMTSQKKQRRKGKARGINQDLIPRCTSIWRASRIEH
jgi:high-affinity Fe2+/Pb2+ permease